MELTTNRGDNLRKGELVLCATISKRRAVPGEDPWGSATGLQGTAAELNDNIVVLRDLGLKMYSIPSHRMHSCLQILRCFPKVSNYIYFLYITNNCSEQVYLT